MCDPHDEHDEPIVLDRIDDAPVTLADSVERIGGALELNCRLWPRLVLESLQSPEYSLLDGWIEFLQLTPGGWCQFDLECHRALQPELVSHNVEWDCAFLAGLPEGFFSLPDVDLIF